MATKKAKAKSKAAKPAKVVKKKRIRKEATLHDFEAHEMQFFLMGLGVIIALFAVFMFAYANM